ncbi:ABC transporter permease [Ensifer adhaerens]|uniref:ABC transporter permease n=1 Tax=Ensifer adhaerens TaxID=106592 RepID=UPI000DDC9125|nr:ABC transporter permease [Ensifer adhaerens]MBW0365450.1 ABC transporter permease [Ensifer adhaerens]UCM22784.1 ABC transporter permease [Ensifer adhaerens]
MSIGQSSVLMQRIQIKTRVVNALVIRDLMLRFGHGNIGFLWLVGEPLILTVGVMIVWSFVYGSQKHGVNIMPLVLTGYSTLTLFRHFVNRYVHCFRHNAGLLFHRCVKPADTLIGRGLLESVGVLIAFFVAYIPLLLLEATDPIDDYLIVLGAWALLCFACHGFAMILACLSELSDTVERFVQPTMYLLIPLTGSFYMVSWLPETAQKVVLYSPLVQANEMLRFGYFGPSVKTYWDASYLFLCGLGLNALGFPLMKVVQKRVESE